MAICRYHGNVLLGTVEKCVLHIYNQRHTCVPSFMEIGQKLRKEYATQNFPSFWLIIYELLPWQHTFCHCQEMCHADLHPKTNIQYEFHENWKNTDEAVLPWSILPYILPITCRYHGNIPFATAEICVLHINISRWTFVPNFIKIDQKLWEEFTTQDLYPFLLIICRYHGNILLGTVEKCVLHIYNPRHTSVPSFMGIGWKLRK